MAAQRPPRYRFRDLDDVDFPSFADGEFVRYEAATGKFVGEEATGSSSVSFSGVVRVVGGVLSGSATTSDLPEGDRLYHTTERVREALTATAPLGYNSSTGAFTLPVASATTSGWLSSTDWSTFNAKQASLGYTPANRAGDSLTGPLSITPGDESTALVVQGGTGSLSLGTYLQEWRDEDAVLRMYVDWDANGIGFTQSGASLRSTSSLLEFVVTGGKPFQVRSGSNSTVVTQFRGTSGQTANLTTWMKGASTVGSMSANGLLTVANLTLGSLEGLLKASGGVVTGSAGSSDITGALGYTPVNQAGDTGMTGRYVIGSAPTVTANYGILNIGDKPFDGTTANFFVGKSQGTGLAMNFASGFGGETTSSFVDVQVAGSRAFRFFDGGQGAGRGFGVESASHAALNVASGYGFFITGGTLCIPNHSAVAALRVYTQGQNRLVFSVNETTAKVQGIGSSVDDDTQAGCLINPVATVSTYYQPVRYKRQSDSVVRWYVNSDGEHRVAGEGNIAYGLSADSSGMGFGKTSGNWGISAWVLGNVRAAIMADSLWLHKDHVLKWGSTSQYDPNYPVDTNLYRGGTDCLKTDDRLYVAMAPPASGFCGLLSLGSAPFDGVTANTFAGSVSGTLIAGNATSGYTGNLVDLQLDGVRKFQVPYTGRVYTVADLVSDSATKGIILKDGNGHYWRLTITTLGAVTTTDLGTSLPA